MKHKIDRHPDKNDREFRESMVRGLRGIPPQKTDGGTIDTLRVASLSGHGVRNAIVRACVDVDDPKILECLEWGASASAGVFLAAGAAKGATVEFLGPRGERLETIGAPGLSEADPSTLIQGLMACWIARDGEAADVLRCVPLDRLRQRWGVEERAVVAAAAFQSLAELVGAEGEASRQEARVLAARAFETALVVNHPAMLREAERIWQDSIGRPRLRVALAIAADDEVRLQEELVSALEAHRYYYGVEPTPKSSSGQLSVDVLALACVAHDLGMRVDVESDYVPRWLIEHAR